MTTKKGRIRRECRPFLKKKRGSCFKPFLWTAESKKKQARLFFISIKGKIRSRVGIFTCVRESKAREGFKFFFPLKEKVESQKGWGEVVRLVEDP